MKKRLHKIIIPVAFYHFIFSLITYLIFGLLYDPTFVTQVWFIPNMMVVMTEIMLIMVSRLLDPSYRSIFGKRVENE